MKRKNRLGENRKFKFALFVFITATLIFLLPLLNIPPFLTGAEWISVVSMTFLFYSGANVLSKRQYKEDVVADPEDKLKEA